jgi:diguanylate cyclase (GGDEF)-like protein
MNQAQVQLKKGRILIVDDFPENLRLLIDLLHKYGYQVQSAINGEIAFQEIATTCPDLILLDIIMPGMDGYQICQILKNSKQTHDIPIIFLSGLDTEAEKVKAFKVGAVDYITKPFYLEEAIARIENHLNIRRHQKLLKQAIKQQSEQLEDTTKMLDRSRTLLNGFLNTSQDGVTIFESIRNRHHQIVDFVCILANPLAVMAIGNISSQSKLVGKRLLKDFPDNLLKRLFEFFIEVVDNCTVVDKEYYYQQQSFQAWFHIVVVKLNDGFIANFCDITENKQMELALQEANQELHLQANLDSLTQIANRRRFDEYLTQEWARCAREQKPLSLILCDVDFFKAYNDNYGHQAGDLCLAKVAQSMNLVIKRPSDLLVRYGGEEFAVVLPHTKSEGALKVAEDIRSIIKQQQIPHAFSGISQHITLSLGVAAIIPSPNFSAESLIAAADRALYEAKQLGRDRVVGKTIEQPFLHGVRE